MFWQFLLPSQLLSPENEIRGRFRAHQTGIRGQQTYGSIWDGFPLMIKDDTIYSHFWQFNKSQSWFGISFPILFQITFSRKFDAANFNGHFKSFLLVPHPCSPSSNSKNVLLNGSKWPEPFLMSASSSNLAYLPQRDTTLVRLQYHRQTVQFRTEKLINYHILLWNLTLRVCCSFSARPMRSFSQDFPKNIVLWFVA